MGELKQGILSKGHSVNGNYSVLLLVKKSPTSETYRIKGIDGKLYILKIFYPTKLHRSSFDNDKNILEIEILKALNNKNIVSYKDSGDLIIENRKYYFLILQFVIGETLSAKLSRESISTIYDIKQIVSGILKGLDYLHTLSSVIIHNGINPDNIMLDLSGDVAQTKIIDFGHARSFLQSSKVFNREGINLSYLSSECFNNIFSPQSDLFSVGAVMYKMLFGIAPWAKDFSRYDSDNIRQEELIINERKKDLSFPNIENRILDYDNNILDIVKKALHPDLDIRFRSAKEFLSALNGDPIIQSTTSHKAEKTEEKDSVTKLPVKKGKGFRSIAGMKQLKEQLQHDVINVIENPEEYKKHNLGLPNGMLLYGPPGCGKTFFAERFAEEAGYNFIKIVSSDIASIYVHGSQEKIGKLFNDAREKAPTILYFDELDAMVPNRENTNNQSQSGEVNEFLSQLDNIGHSGVFVIGSTNKPDLIDKAILRAGRLEKWYYIPPPDYDARKALFELYLKQRPVDLGIDYDKLAGLTVNYVSSDIKLLIDESSRKTIRDRTKRITMDTLEFIIRTQKPTVSLTELKKYEAVRKKIEQEIDDSNERPRIGFKQ
jgi:transitional endoplasmic reticulum ATPase